MVGGWLATYLMGTVLGLLFLEAKATLSKIIHYSIVKIEDAHVL